MINVPPFLYKSSLAMAARAVWWKPWTWGEVVSDAIDAIQGMLNKAFVSGTHFSLEKMTGMFNSSVNALRSEVALTPYEFDSTLVSVLRGITESVVLPIAVLLITYVFVLQIIEQVTEKNKGGEWDLGSAIMLIIKTTLMIYLATHAFTIGLAFSDVSTYMINQVPSEQVQLTEEISNSILSSLEPEIVVEDEEGNKVPANEGDENSFWDYKLGESMITMLISFVGLVITMIIGAIIYLVAWSRMIMILLYITVAPIPMATLMSETWVSSIGQNYLKNLLALTLQGFLMLVLLVIYQGLITRTAGLIEAGSGGLQGLLLLLVSMGIVAKLLIGTHSLAKSITGAV